MALLPLLLKLLFVIWAASVGLDFGPSVCSVAELVFGGLFVCHLSKHFSADHSVVILFEQGTSVSHSNEMH